MVQIPAPRLATDCVGEGRGLIGIGEGRSDGPNNRARLDRSILITSGKTYTIAKMHFLSVTVLSLALPDGCLASPDGKLALPEDTRAIPALRRVMSWRGWTEH